MIVSDLHAGGSVCVCVCTGGEEQLREMQEELPNMALHPDQSSMRAREGRVQAADEQGRRLPLLCDGPTLPGAGAQK